MKAYPMGKAVVNGYDERYVARPRLAGTFLQLFENASLPKVRQQISESGACIGHELGATSASVVTVYVDCAREQGYGGGLERAVMQEHTQAIWTAATGKRELVGRILATAGERIGLVVQSNTVGEATPECRRVSLWTSYLYEKHSNQPISVLLYDTESKLSAGLGSSWGLYESVSNTSSAYPLTTMLQDLRALTAPAGQTGLPMRNPEDAIAGACQKYRRVTGRSLNRELVHQAFQALRPRPSQVQGRHR